MLAKKRIINQGANSHLIIWQKKNCERKVPFRESEHVERSGNNQFHKPLSLTSSTRTLKRNKTAT